ncbi:MAG TPA: phosphoglycerate mutase [Rhodanobacteraceae bacterium]
MSVTAYALLPALARFDAVDGFRQRLVRADALPAGPANELAVGACFRWPDQSLPVAALIREHVMHDAGDHAWLCADLAHVQPDMTGVRMLACGNLDLSRDEAEALAQPLRPVFGDRGLLLETTLPARWHVHAPASSPWPVFDPPSAVLGDDLVDHLPAGDAGRGWRQLLNETQILLHQHPLNQARRQRGLPTINSLWLWGAGSLPAWIKSDVQQVYGDDLPMTALATRASVMVRPLTDLSGRESLSTDVLLDLRRSADAQACRDLLLGLLDDRRIDTLVLHFAGGERWRLQRGQRWRFWRRAQ